MYDTNLYFYIILETRLISVDPIIIGGFISWSLSVALLVVLLKYIKHDFLSLHEAYLAWYMESCFEILFASILYTSCFDFAFTNILVSSANRISSFELHMLLMSFIYIRKSNGPRKLPWGTPNITPSCSEISPRADTHCFLLDK